MRFSSPLIPATLIRRYKRFLADVVLRSGDEITADIANPGAMTGIATPGARVWLSKSDDPKRKLPYAWELVEADFGAGPELVGVNTAHPSARERGVEALAYTCNVTLDGIEVGRRVPIVI